MPVHSVIATRSTAGLLFTALLAFPASARADNWPQWRGPTGDSVSREMGLPAQWSEGSANVRRVALPEWGTSTPAVWNDALFITTEADGKLLVLRMNDTTGETVWTRTAGEGAARRKSPDSGKRSSKFHDLHNMASPSPVTDGERVIVHFGNGALVSYTFDGREEWRRNLADDHGGYTIWWGHANSPVLHGDLVISVCMQDSMEGERETLAPSYVVAHDKRTGKPVWHTPRMTGANAEECDSYTTPLIRELVGVTEIVIMGGNRLDGYDAATGKLRWSLPGLVGGRTITGPTLSNDLVFATIGMRGPLHAVRPKSGKLSPDDSVVWKATQSTPDSCCPVVVNGLLFMIADNGAASCINVETGKQHWQKRIPGDYKASPIAADGRIYFLNRGGVCTVVAASKDFEQIAENKLDDEFTASPAVSNGRLYLRGKRALHIISR